jgi:hypothetical protein
MGVARRDDMGVARRDDMGVARRDDMGVACSTSRTRSSACSMPTDRRTSESGIPACARASGLMDACVIVAGCATRLSTPPSDSASVK